MMDLPRCKICGDRHRLGACPKFDASEQRRAWLQGMSQARPVKKSGPDRARPQGEASNRTGGEPPPALEKKSKAKFDRNAYQRDYMRNRRKKK